MTTWYANPWFLFIQAVNAALIVGIVWLDWPSKVYGWRLRATTCW
jgi:hypothetical protein